MATIERYSQEAWDQLPPANQRKPSQWDGLLDEVQAGEVMLIKGDQKEQRGARIALGRLAKARGITLEYRPAPDGLAVRQADKPPVHAAARLETEGVPSSPARRRGRRPKRTMETPEAEEASITDDGPEG